MIDNFARALIEFFYWSQQSITHAVVELRWLCLFDNVWTVQMTLNIIILQILTRVNRLIPCCITDHHHEKWKMCLVGSDGTLQCELRGIPRSGGTMVILQRPRCGSLSKLVYVWLKMEFYQLPLCQFVNLRVKCFVFFNVFTSVLWVKSYRFNVKWYLTCYIYIYNIDR